MNSQQRSRPKHPTLCISHRRESEVEEYNGKNHFGSIFLCLESEIVQYHGIESC